MWEGRQSLTLPLRVQPIGLFQDFMRQSLRETLLSSLQNMTRPVDDFSDSAWAHMAHALNERYDNALKRVDGWETSQE